MVYIYIYIYIKGNKSDIMKKSKKNPNNPKSDVESFRCNKFLQDFKFMKNVVKIMMDV